MSSRARAAPVALLALPVAAVVLLFLMPLGEMMRLSVAGGLVNYTRFFGDAYYLTALGVTLGTAMLVTVISLAVAYPLAYTYWQASGRLRAVLVVGLLAPFYANVVVKVFGWMVLLPSSMREGFWAIVLVDVHRALPFMTLMLAAAMARIEPEVMESARLCGARPFRVFRTVVLPLSHAGAVGGSILVFSLTAASFVVPLLVGGPFGGRFLSVLVYQQITIAQNWSFGAAIGAVLLLTTMVAVGVASRAVRTASVGRVMEDAFRG